MVMASLGNCRDTGPGHKRAGTGGQGWEGSQDHVLQSKHCFELQGGQMSVPLLKRKSGDSALRLGDKETHAVRCSLNNGLTECIFLTISRCKQQSHMGDLFLLQQKSIGHDINVLFQEKSNSTKLRRSWKFKEKQFLLLVLMNTVK